jgi:hypothetical protein
MSQFTTNIPIEKLEAELLDSGLLYAINKMVLHPLGLALALVYEDINGPPRGIELVATPKREPWSFDPELAKSAGEKLIAYLNAHYKAFRAPSNDLVLRAVASPPEPDLTKPDIVEVPGINAPGETVTYERRPALLHRRQDGRLVSPIVMRDFLMDAFSGSSTEDTSSSIRHRVVYLMREFENETGKPPVQVFFPAWLIPLWAEVNHSDRAIFLGLTVTMSDNDQHIYVGG